MPYGRWESGPLVEWGQGSSDRLEAHQNDGLELVWVERGHLQWQIDGRAVDVVPDTLLFTWPWEVHGSRREWEPGHAWRFYVVRIEGTGPDDLRFAPGVGLTERESHHLVERLRGCVDRRIPVDRRLAHSLEWLTSVLRDAPADPSLVRRILAGVLLEVGARAGRIVADQDRREAEEATVTERVVAVLSANLGASWTLARIGDAVGLQRTRLTEIVRRQQGESPMRLLRRLRLEAARRRLAEATESVSEIAADLGFGTPQQFSAAFRARYGVPPSAYRARWRAGRDGGAGSETGPAG